MEKNIVLTADSGSTKTEWLLTSNGRTILRLQTTGLNPIVMGLSLMRKHLEEELIPQIPGEMVVREVHFFGAGCTPQQCPLVAEMLTELFPQAVHVEVDSDLVGAAKSLLDADEGLVAILGTGASSCLWDGERISQRIPALGFILGDEGSGAVLGKLFINGIMKGTLPRDIRDLFLAEYSLSETDIINKVYKGDAPNKFLASCSPFIYNNLQRKELRDLVIRNFRDFFQKNIKPYGRADLPVNFIGSMAFCYEDQLREAALQEGFLVGVIKQKPL